MALFPSRFSSRRAAATVEFQPTLATGSFVKRGQTTNEIVNEWVKKLDVVCIGAEGGCLYFKTLPTADRSQKPDDLARGIISRLLEPDAPPEIRKALQQAEVTTISISIG